MAEREAGRYQVNYRPAWGEQVYSDARPCGLSDDEWELVDKASDERLEFMGDAYRFIAGLVDIVYAHFTVPSEMPSHRAHRLTDEERQVVEWYRTWVSGVESGRGGYFRDLLAIIDRLSGVGSSGAGT